MRFEQGAAIARERAQGGCEACGRARGTQSHHRQPRGAGGVSRSGLAVNLPSNLIRACGDCHRWVESFRAVARDLGLLVPRPLIPAEVRVWLCTAQGEAWWLLDDAGSYTWVDDSPPAVRVRST
jgi:5-methylcytosine-specific restriction enzyme A